MSFKFSATGSDNFVTGSSGFLGSRLLKEFPNTEATETVPHEHIDALLCVQAKRLFFLSSYGNLAHQTFQRLIWKANVADAVRLLDCIDEEVKFVYVSSSAVNQKPTTYSLAKLAGECAVQALCPKGIIIRPYSVTGVGEQACHLIPRLIHCAFTGDEMPFFPDATHDFVDVTDVARGIADIGRHESSGIFELGSGVGHTNQEVKELVERVVGRKANTTPWKGRSYDSKDWVCSRRPKNWAATKSLEQSITEMVEDYAKRSGKKGH